MACPFLVRGSFLLSFFWIDFRNQLGIFLEGHTGRNLHRMNPFPTKRESSPWYGPDYSDIDIYLDWAPLVEAVSLFRVGAPDSEDVLFHGRGK